MSKRATITSTRSSSTSSKDFDKHSQTIRYSSIVDNINRSMDPIDANFDAIERPREARAKRSMIVKCPLCLDDFPSSEIERHASLCLELNELITKPKSPAKSQTAKAEKSNTVMKDGEVSAKSTNKARSSFTNSMKTMESQSNHSFYMKKPSAINSVKPLKGMNKKSHQLHDATLPGMEDKKIGSNYAKKSAKRCSNDSKIFVMEYFPEVKKQTLSRALNSTEQSNVHGLDLEIQRKFPSNAISKIKKNTIIYKTSVSEKPFASINDARRFLFLLENFISARNSSTSKKKNPSDSHYTSRFVLSYIKMTKDFAEEKITLTKFINSFLLLFMKELLLDIESRISKAVEILKMFNSFLPSSHHLVNEFPEICGLLIMSDAACSKFEQVFTKQKLNQFCKKIQNLA